MRGVTGAAVVAVLVAVVGLPAAATGDLAPPPYGTLQQADDFTGSAGPLPEGDLELAVLSTRAETVTGGDALVGVRGLTPQDDVTVLRNGQDVTDAFVFDDDGIFAGLVDGFVDGDNEVTVIANHAAHGRRGATLPIRNHPITGPVFSGPHQEPFVCRTVAAGLGEPIDANCSVEPRVEWFYFDQVEQDFQPLEDPYDSYPQATATTTTTEGATVPYVVRVESRTINRGITRVAVLDDPAARGPDAPHEVSDAWNDRVLYQWGASCGVGRHQGVNQVDAVLTNLLDVGTGAVSLPGSAVEAPVGQGYMTAASTLTTLGVHCNQVLSAETFMMVREHIAEQYGLPAFVFGNGASGGAIQQVTTMDNYPGLLDGGIPMITFPDVITTAMSPSDCRLMLDVFASDTNTWNEVTIQAVTGHRTSQICRDWDDLFAGHLVAASGCDGSVPSELIYHPDDNPGGVRCTLQDALVNVMGIDASTGFANRPLDNEGVQYGLQALDDGLITAEMFVDLNEQVGGFDIDGNIVSERMSMDPDLARKMYEIGAVVGRGALVDSPIIFISTYVDVVPILGFHDAVRAYMLRERLRSVAGTDQTHAIWAGLPLPNDAWPVMDEWLTALTPLRHADAAPFQSWVDDVVATRPADADDACVVTSGGIIGAVDLIIDAGEVGGTCETLFAPLGSPRIVAGGPLSEDIIKCSLGPLDRDAHPGSFSDEQWERLQAAFPTGVCDWDQPGVGEVERSQTWLGIPADGGEPVEIGHTVARSGPVVLAEDSETTPLPATGAGGGLMALLLLAMAGFVRSRASS